MNATLPSFVTPLSLLPSFRRRSLRRGGPSLTLSAADPSNARAGPAPAADGGPAGAPGGVHPSWGVYRRPGDLCVVCAGAGSARCLYCFGAGVVIIGPEKDRDTLACPQCNGRKTEVCPRCHGSGKRPRHRVVARTGERIPNLTNEEVLRGLGEDPERVRVEREGTRAAGQRMEEEGRRGEEGGEENLRETSLRNEHGEEEARQEEEVKEMA